MLEINPETKIKTAAIIKKPWQFGITTVPCTLSRKRARELKTAAE
jgi:hypothetical protein